MSFNRFKLKPALLKALEQADFLEPTDIQQQGIPAILEGKDVVGQSKTGSGKTLAFGLPILDGVKSAHGIQALILTPTRELCVQVCDALHQFAKPLDLHTTSVYGGVGIGPQFKALRDADIVVGTPGRILDHMERGTINYEHLRYLVLDEVDRMADMGFIRDVERILSALPEKRQTLLFSATISADVHKLVKRYLHDPAHLKSETYVSTKLLKQHYYDTDPRDKFSLLLHLLKTGSKGLKLIFCATRHEVDIVARNLQQQQINVMAIHGGLTQSRRLKALELLKKEHIEVLVATDVAARGLDIRNVQYVYNYDVPRTSEEYIHRIGRTARAGEAGQAITLLTARDHDAFRRVLRDHTLEIHKEAVPEFERVRFERPQRRESSGFGSPRGRFGSREGGRPGYGGRGRGGETRGHYGHRNEERSAEPREERSFGGPRGRFGSREGGSYGHREGGSRFGRSERPSYGRSEGREEGSRGRFGRSEGGRFGRSEGSDRGERPQRFGQRSGGYGRSPRGESRSEHRFGSREPRGQDRRKRQRKAY